MAAPDLLPPGAFIEIAESTNLAVELGRHVLRTACAEFRRWLSEGLDTSLRLNVIVSSVQLVTDGFVDTVISALDEFGLDGSAICLEITESAVVQDGDASRATLEGLKEVGVQIAIDDFGTGYSVLSHLKTLPVDLLKIDKGFVLELGANERDLAIVRATVALADSFGLDVLAEGVETLEARAPYRSWGASGLRSSCSRARSTAPKCRCFSPTDHCHLASQPSRSTALAARHRGGLQALWRTRALTISMRSRPGDVLPAVAAYRPGDAVYDGPTVRRG